MASWRDGTAARHRAFDPAMAKTPHSAERGRLRFAIGVAALHILLAWALLVGLGVKMPARVAESLTLIDLRPLPPQPVDTTSGERTRRKQPDSPRNLKARPAEVVAPKPQVVVPAPPPPVVAAPVAGLGDEREAGLADIFGPGSGDGGAGAGAGGEGDGDGDGGRTPSRRVAGRIKSSDYPRAARDAGVEGTVTVRYTVGVEGRVTDCRVARSSGSPELDDTTCRLILQRFRFEPGRDAAGRPIPDGWEEEHIWTMGGHRERD